MHIFLLIISISGHAEHVAAECKTYQQCSDLGAKCQEIYVRQFHKQPRDFTYRIIETVRNES